MADNNNNELRPTYPTSGLNCSPIPDALHIALIQNDSNRIAIGNWFQNVLISNMNVLDE